MLTSSLALVYAGVLGLAVGSFLNVLVYRLPRQQAVGWARSRCPFCGGRIAARDNIPLISYLLLRGRCRRCGAPIAARYPLLEALTAALFVACAARFDLPAEASIAALFCALLIALAAIDIEHFLLPDKLTLTGVLAGLALQPWFPRTGWLDAVVGTLVGAGILILIINFWFWWRGEEGMGLGDVNMLAMVGAFLGWQGVMITLVAASFSGALVGGSLMALERLGLKSKLPFGAFLAIGACIALFWGKQLAALYLRLL